MLVLKYISGFCSKEIFVWTTNSMGPFMRLFQYFTYRYCLNCNPSFTNLDFLELSYCFFLAPFQVFSYHSYSYVMQCIDHHWFSFTSKTYQRPTRYSQLPQHRRFYLQGIWFRDDSSVNCWRISSLKKEKVKTLRISLPSTLAFLLPLFPHSN